MATAEQYLAQAAKYIGVSGDHNIFNEWYWCDLNGYSYDPGWAWCACYQSYVGVHDLGMPFSPSASAAGVANQGIRVADGDAQPGDWVLFNWDGRQDFGWADHIGVVEWSDINGSGYFGTIEGNTGNGYEGTVARCTRYNWGSYATAFFRPPYSSSPSPQPTPPAPTPTDNIRYCVNSGIWLPEMIGLYDTSGSGDDYAGIMGNALRYIAIEGVGDYRVCTQASGWLPWVNGYNPNDLEYGCAGDGSPIIALEIPNSSVKYWLHNLGGGWNDAMIGNRDTGGSSDTYAGAMVPADAVSIEWA